MDEYNIIHQCHMESVADLFSSKQDITAALGGNLKQSLFTSESYSSYPNNNNNNNNGKSQTSFDERPNKLLKTYSWKSTTTTDRASADHSSPTPQPHFLNFDQKPISSNPNKQLYGNLNMYSCSLKPKVEAPPSTGNTTSPPPFPPLGSQNYETVINPNHGTKRSYPVTRTPALAQDHIMAERKRREKLSQRFIALSAILPGLKKVYMLL